MLAPASGWCLRNRAFGKWREAWIRGLARSVRYVRRRTFHSSPVRIAHAGSMRRHPRRIVVRLMGSCSHTAPLTKVLSTRRQPARCCPIQTDRTIGRSAQADGLQKRRLRTIHGRQRNDRQGVLPAGSVGVFLRVTNMRAASAPERRRMRKLKPFSSETVLGSSEKREYSNIWLRSDES